jgi:hypothetical protein
MKSFTTPDFWNSYAAIPPEIKEQTRKTYRSWIENPSYPSLHFKKVGKNLWSVRITRNYRALALKKGKDFYWIWIGTHDQYEILLS